MNSEELKTRTKEFAHRCVKLVSALPNGELSRIVGSQLMRSATSVAANYRAACLAQSKPAFVTKISIVLEEADESAFWLEFIVDEGLLKPNLVNALVTEANALTRIFAASRKTSSGK